MNRIKPITSYFTAKEYDMITQKTELVLEDLAILLYFSSNSIKTRFNFSEIEII